MSMSFIYETGEHVNYLLFKGVRDVRHIQEKFCLRCRADHLGYRSYTLFRMVIA